MVELVKNSPSKNSAYNLTRITQKSPDAKNFNSWVFKYHLLKPGQKVLEIEAAFCLLNIVMAKQNKEYCEKFVEFLKATGKKVMTHDQWINLSDVLKTFENNEEYDASGSCILIFTKLIGPSLFDEFYKYLHPN